MGSHVDGGWHLGVPLVVLFEVVGCSCAFFVSLGAGPRRCMLRLGHGWRNCGATAASLRDSSWELEAGSMAKDPAKKNGTQIRL